MEKVISTSGHFAMVGGSITFVGTVTIETESGEHKHITGEHGNGDYDWNGHWEDAE